MAGRLLSPTEVAAYDRDGWPTVAKRLMPADIMAAARAPFKVQGRRYQMVGAKQHAAGWAEAFRLRDAAERGDKPAVALLLAAGADVNGYSGKTRWTALHAAADRGRLEVVGLLLSFGADLTLRTTAGATALKLACSAGRVACATELLAAGADPNGCPGPTGQTALHTALRTGHVETIRVLVQSGADPDLPRQPVPAGHLPMTARQMAESRVGALALPTSTDFKLTSAKVMRDPSYLSMADVAVNYGRELDDGLLPSLAPSIYAADFAAPPPVPAGPPHMPGGGEEQEDGEVGGQVGVGGGEDIFSMKVAEEAAAAEAERDLAEAEANAEEARQQMLAEEQADAAKLEALRKAEFVSSQLPPSCNPWPCAPLCWTTDSGWPTMTGLAACSQPAAGSRSSRAAWVRAGRRGAEAAA